MRIEYSNSQDLSNSNDSAKERPGGQSLLGEDDISLKLRRLATQIAEMHSSGEVYFVGIHTRGVTVAKRVKALLSEMGINVQLGTLDISFYRDDLDHMITNPKVQSSEIPFEIEGNNIIIFDDDLNIIFNRKQRLFDIYENESIIDLSNNEQFMEYFFDDNFNRTGISIKN